MYSTVYSIRRNAVEVASCSNCKKIDYAVYVATYLYHHVNLWKTFFKCEIKVYLACQCAHWSLQTCSKCVESKCIEQSMLGKEPQANISYDKCGFDGYKLNYSDSEALGWMGKNHWFAFSCPSFMLWNNDNSRGKTEVIIYHLLHHTINQYFCLLVGACVWVWEKAMGIHRWKESSISVLTWSIHHTKFVQVSVSNGNLRDNSKSQKSLFTSRYCYIQWNTHTLLRCSFKNALYH